MESTQNSGKHFTYICLLIIQDVTKDTDGQPGEEMYRVRCWEEQLHPSETFMWPKIWKLCEHWCEIFFIGYLLKLFLFWNQINVIPICNIRIICVLYFYFILFFAVVRFELGLLLEPLPWLFHNRFFWDRISQITCPSWLQTAILLISAS
jgi:hypothetical protein